MDVYAAREGRDDQQRERRQDRRSPDADSPGTSRSEVVTRIQGAVLATFQPPQIGQLPTPGQSTSQRAVFPSRGDEVAVFGGRPPSGRSLVRHALLSCFAWRRPERRHRRYRPCPFPCRRSARRGPARQADYRDAPPDMPPGRHESPVRPSLHCLRRRRPAVQARKRWWSRCRRLRARSGMASSFDTSLAENAVLRVDGHPDFLAGRYQQNLRARQIALVVLTGSTKWRCYACTPLASPPPSSPRLPVATPKSTCRSRRSLVEADRGAHPVRFLRAIRRSVARRSLTGKDGAMVSPVGIDNQQIKRRRKSHRTTSQVAIG